MPTRRRVGRTVVGFTKNNRGAVTGGMIAFVVMTGLNMFNQQLGAGKVPIPETMIWIAPIASGMIGAVIAVLTPYATGVKEETRSRARRSRKLMPLKSDDVG